MQMRRDRSELGLSMEREARREYCNDNLGNQLDMRSWGQSDITVFLVEHRDRRPDWEKNVLMDMLDLMCPGNRVRTGKEKSRVQVKDHQGLLNFGITISVKVFFFGYPFIQQPFSEDFYVPRTCGAGIQENKFIRLD